MSEADDVRRHEAERWFAIVAEDVDVARASAGLAHPRLGSAAYHLQQACEKILKGLLVLAGHRIRKTHDLDDLATEATPLYPQWAASFNAMRGLTVWGIAYRYPGMDDAPEPEPTLSEIESAIKVVETLIIDIRAQLG